MRVVRLADALQIFPLWGRHAGPIAVCAATAVASMTGRAFAQTSTPPRPSPSGSETPTVPPGGYAPPNAPPPQRNGPPPQPSQPGAPPPGAPPPAYQQPAYQQPSGPPNYPPPAYQQPNYQQPNYPQQGPQPPVYGQPAGYGGYTEPPLPPPPKRSELQWSIRFDLLNLLFGRATGEIEYAFAGPLSLTIIPEYIFADPRQDRSYRVTASGGGIAGELGFWVEGRPLRGYFLKAHAGYRSIKFQSDLQDIKVPATEVGAMFGSQSIYGGWFTLSGAFGVVYDFQSEDRAFLAVHPAGGPTRYTIGASGLFGNGFDLLAQLAIGGSF